MSRIYSSSDKKVDIGSLLKKHTRDQRSAVSLIAPRGIRLVILQIIPCIFQHAKCNRYANKKPVRFSRRLGFSPKQYFLKI